MSENKMAEVAQLLGVELDEDFEIIGCSNRIFRLTRHGLCQLAKDGTYHSLDLDDSIMNTLDKLLSGIVQIKEKPWKAELNENYYTPFPASPLRYQLIVNNGSKQDDEWYNDGLMCKTKEQAIKTAEAMIKVAREMQGIDESE